MEKVKAVKKNTYFSLVATEIISAGEIILQLKGNISPTPGKYSVQVGTKEHLFPFSEDPKDESSFFRFINHSCSPNSYFHFPDRNLIALSDIGENEEIVFHYCTTEYEMASPFQCLCKSENCLTEIKGFKYLSQEQSKKLLPLVAPHLKSRTP